MQHWALASTVSPITPCGEPLFSRWCALAEGRQLAFVGDGRLPLPFADELLDQLNRAGHRCAALTLPTTGPQVLSDDRAEREAAAKLWSAFADLADRRRCGRLVLQPSRMELFTAPSELQRLHSRGEVLDLEQLKAQRASLVPMMRDRLRGALDPLLERCAARGLCLDLAIPPVWPHQFPNHDELVELKREFSGAPLFGAFFSDWQHGGPVLDPPTDPSEDPSEAQLPLEVVEMLAKHSESVEDLANQLMLHQNEAPETLPLGQLWLADAAGLTGQLPPGTGEIRWAEMMAKLPQPLPELMVIASDEQTNATELHRALTLLEAAMP